jgi:hypothetical protein
LFGDDRYPAGAERCRENTSAGDDFRVRQGESHRHFGSADGPDLHCHPLLWNLPGLPCHPFR